MAKPGAPPFPPPLPGQHGGLGEKIEHTIERVLRWSTVMLMETISGWIGWAFELFMHALRPGMLRVFGPFLRFYRDLSGTPDEFKDLINEALLEDGEAAAAVLGVVGSSVGGAAIGSVTTSLFAPITYAVNRAIKPRRADPAMAIANAWRWNLSREAIDSQTDDLGWESSYIFQLGETMRPRPDAVSMLMLWRRGKLAEMTLDDELKARGYEPADVARLKQATEIIPGPADLISMAVREAWRDDVAARWGYDADFPAEFAEWMVKQGDVDGWARRYWRAHWTLPGLTTVLEILHREDDFTLDDLDTFLRVSDIPSAWRDYIKKIAYVPLTRVDTRRMYGLGVLSRDEVKRNYLDLGYDDLNAERMTEFTIRYETDEDREATKTDILSFYTSGSLTASEAQAWLQDIGYPENLARYLVARETTKAKQKHIAEQVAYLKNMYTHQEIGVASVTAQLGALGLAPGEIEKLLDTWDIARRAKVERPSRATLDKLFKQDVIAESEYTAGLDALGYQAQYIAWYTASVLLIKSEDARKEEEKARDEQEAIRKRKVRSDYQIDKAGLDVDLAEIATAIAETQLALQARRSRYEEELRVAREILTVAQLEEAAAAEIAELEAQIGDLREAIAFLREGIEGLETEIAGLRLALAEERELVAPDVAVLEGEVAALEAEIAGLQEEIEADQTSAAAITLAMAGEAPPYTPEEADEIIKALALEIEGLQDEIAARNTLLGARREEIRLLEDRPAAIEVRVDERLLAIERHRDDVAAAEFGVAETRSAIGARRAKLRADLGIVERIRTIEEIEADYRADLATMTARLSTLRVNLTELREQKAVLAVEYRVGIAP